MLKKRLQRLQIDYDWPGGGYKTVTKSGKTVTSRLRLGFFGIKNGYKQMLTEFEGNITHSVYILGGKFSERPDFI